MINPLPDMHYDAEVKARAVRLLAGHPVESSSVTKSCEAVGRRLGISKETLRGWCRQAQVDAGESDRPVVSPRPAVGFTRREAQRELRVSRWRRWSGRCDFWKITAT